MELRELLVGYCSFWYVGKERMNRILIFPFLHSEDWVCGMGGNMRRGLNLKRTWSELAILTTEEDFII